MIKGTKIVSGRARTRPIGVPSGATLVTTAPLLLLQGSFLIYSPLGIPEPPSLSYSLTCLYILELRTVSDQLTYRLEASLGARCCGMHPRTPGLLLHMCWHNLPLAEAKLMACSISVSNWLLGQVPVSSPFWDLRKEWAGERALPNHPTPTLPVLAQGPQI